MVQRPETAHHAPRYSNGVRHWVFQNRCLLPRNAALHQKAGSSAPSQDVAPHVSLSLRGLTRHYNRVLHAGTQTVTSSSQGPGTSAALATGTGTARSMRCEAPADELSMVA